MIRQTVIAHNNTLLFTDKILWKSLWKIGTKKDKIL